MKKVKNISFYEKAIRRNEYFIEEHKKWLQSYQGELNKAILTSNLAYFVWHLNNMIASYSKGDGKDSLSSQFSEAVKVMEQVWDKRRVKMHMGKSQKEIDVYYIGPTFYMRWMLSLGVLLDVPDDEFQILVNLIKRDNIKDALYDICIKTRIKDWQISDVVRPLSPKNKIIDIINEVDKSVCEKLTKTYLEKHWFKTFKNWGGWKNTDVSDLDVNSGFVGFWAFEVAALVKIKALDDSSFRDSRFYPNRLV